MLKMNKLDENFQDLKRENYYMVLYLFITREQFG
jgi:hypothetical protein